MTRGALFAVVLGLAITGASSARGTPDFPQAVVEDLGLPGITIDPPQGCKLCHPTDSGGTSLQPFGQLLQQYGVQPYDEGSLKDALSEVQQNEPQLVADIEDGRDPNQDPDTANLHSPQYGCALEGVPMARSFSSMGGLVAIALLRSMRRRASRTGHAAGEA